MWIDARDEETVTGGGAVAVEGTTVAVDGLMAARDGVAVDSVAGDSEEAPLVGLAERVAVPVDGEALEVGWMCREGRLAVVSAEKIEAAISVADGEAVGLDGVAWELGFLVLAMVHRR